MSLEGPTDVMSFPMDELRPGVGSVTPAGILGDIVICPDVAVQQAVAAGHSAIEEIMLLTAHGILHMLGFDHATPDQEHQMFVLQRQLLLTFLAQRPGSLDEIRREPGSVDMLAQYYADVAASNNSDDGGAADAGTNGKQRG
jgi:probable rRNA maturation factor